MRGVVILASILLLGGCGAEGAPTAQSDALPLQASGDGFTLRMPEGATLVRTPDRPEDFEVYRVERDGLELAFVYIGNAPSFPSVTLPGPISPETDNPQTMSAPSVDGVMRPIEFLWRTECDWPSHIHAGAIGDDTAVTDEAAAIAVSVRPAGCPAL